MNEIPFIKSTIKSTDLRKALSIAPATYNELIKKHDISSIRRSGRGVTKDIPAKEVRRLLQARGFVYPSPAQVFSLMMCKGGVGKTTTSLFLSRRLASYGAKVLVIDGDSQGNLTTALNLEQEDFIIDEDTLILVDVITGDASMEDATIKVSENLHVIPSNPLNSVLEGKIRDKFKNPTKAISKFLEPLKNIYDYIIFDCAPALNLTNTAIVAASDKVLLPVAPDRFSKIGLDQTITEIAQIEADFSLKIEKSVVFTRYDGREFTSLKYLTEIAEEHSDIILKTVIRTAADLKNAITKKEDLFEFKKSNAKEDYDSLAREIMGIKTLFEKKKR